MSQERRITASRLGRLSQLGRLAGGIAGGVIVESARQAAHGKLPSVGDVLMTPANARRLGERLSEMRGAAMKVGQLLSMDSGHLLPPALSDLLSGLREDAHPMPLGQVAEVLKQAWGSGWETGFRRFSFTPLAAASIGQVHRAELKDGRCLAVKIQYPDIQRSIDSDVDNVATLLRLSGLVPAGMDIGALLEEAKAQLHAEADYRREARALTRFASRLADDPRFEVPAVIDEWSTRRVLSMRYLGGKPIESLEDAPRDRRNAAASALLELALREVFEWGLVQTDPNFANYLYDSDTGRIQLLDFGATGDYGEEEREALHELLGACVTGDDDALTAAAIAVGYLDTDDPAGYRDSVIALLRTATEPARVPGVFDFARSDLAQRMRDIVLAIRLQERYARIPPPRILFLHRKLGGLYLLLSRLRASVPVADRVRAALAGTTGASPRLHRRQAG